MRRSALKEMTARGRLLTALRGQCPDRVPCFPSIIRWIRYHYGCTCPRHQLKLAEECGLDPVYTFDLGDAEAVRGAVCQAIVDAAHGGSYVLGTGEAVAPNVPRESLLATSRAACEYGVYGCDL